MRFTFEIIPLANGRLKVRMFNNADLRMKFIPMWLMNFIVRKMAMGTWEKMMSEARKLK